MRTNVYYNYIDKNPNTEKNENWTKTAARFRKYSLFWKEKKIHHVKKKLTERMR